jgi:tRNA G18 (ribose-2'-O)-methylase SpoU
VLAVGSEAEGLSAELLALADLKVRLDHLPRVESLNVAIAGSILMKQIYDLG